MRLIFLIFLISSFSFSQDYEFINLVLPYEKNNPIPNDTIYLYNKFIPLGNQYLNIKDLNEESFRIWWAEIKDKQPPVELFLKNFNFKHIKNDILESTQDSMVDFKRLKKYFFQSDDNFIKLHQTKTYLYISKPVFNCDKDWAFIITSSYIPYADISSGGIMKIYFKMNDNWILYHEFNLWLS